MMEKEFVTYKLALRLKALGFNGPCFGYYAGDMLALYGYTYAFGFGLISTSYFGGTYCLRHLRKKDDYINHAISGFVNAGWMVKKCIRKCRHYDKNILKIIRTKISIKAC
jgi:hypothetical protein